MDYGFHAPTVSFPVAGTLMVEPTESEPKEELDRFCDAMIAIRGEIQAVADGTADREGQRAEERAAHGGGRLAPTSGRTPTRASRPRIRCRRCAHRKFWPPVSRIDNPYGDRNLMCACPPIEAYALKPDRTTRAAAGSAPVGSSAARQRARGTPRAAVVVIGPGVPAPIRRSSTATTGVTSRVVPVMNASSAVVEIVGRQARLARGERRARAASSSTNSRVMPGSSPADERRRAAPRRRARGRSSTASTRRARRPDCCISASSAPRRSASCIASALFSRLFDLIIGFSACG